MVKKISISMPEWVYREYLLGIKSNKSAFIVEMLVEGVKATQNEHKLNQAKISSLLIELKNKEDELRELRQKLGKYDKNLDPEKLAKEEEHRKKVALAKSLQVAGWSDVAK